MRNRLFFLFILFSVVSCGSPKNRVSLINKEPNSLRNFRELVTSDSCISKNGSFDKCLERNSIPALDWIYMGESVSRSWSPGAGSRITGFNYYYISDPRKQSFTNTLVFNSLGILKEKDNYKIIELKPAGTSFKFSCNTFKAKILSESGNWYDFQFSRKLYNNFEQYKRSSDFWTIPRDPHPNDPPGLVEFYKEELDVDIFRNRMRQTKNFKFICRNLVK